MNMKYIVGIIGIGEMGTPIVKNMIDGGHTVFGYDLNPDKMAWLEGAGGIPCSSAVKNISPVICD